MREIFEADTLRALARLCLLYVFVAPPDMDTLRERLVGRGTDAADVVERRLQKAHEEMRAQAKYDHVVVNDDLERAVAEVRDLVGLERPAETGGER